MAENSKIQWTTHTFNPWEGCTKVSPGCKNCYAETLNNRYHKGENWGKGAPRLERSEAYWKEPLKWNREAEGAEERPRVFCASLADWLDDEVPIEWLSRLLDLIRQTPNLDWLLLTKRPENFEERVSEVMTSAEDLGLYAKHALEIASWLDGTPPHNVWIGTSVENQEWADKRIPELLKIPAKVRFLSVEPMLGPIDLVETVGQYSEFEVLEHQIPGIHWVICGGESGPGSRSFALNWAKSLRNQCSAAGVAFFMKQLGANAGRIESGPVSVFGDAEPGFTTVSTKDKKGGDMSEWPEDLRVREFPNP